MTYDINKALTALTIPQVKVVDNSGNPASIDNYDGFMQFVMLAAVNGNLTRIRKVLEDQESEGGAMGYDVAATGRLFRQDFPKPCQSMTLINTGPNAVDVWINSTSNYPRRIRVNQPLAINFGGHKLKCIYLQCGAGATANIEISVKY
jgi:hypothetical protein